jgi:hypothetical protein
MTSRSELSVRERNALRTALDLNYRYDYDTPLPSDDPSKPSARSLGVRHTVRRQIDVYSMRRDSQNGCFDATRARSVLMRARRGDDSRRAEAAAVLGERAVAPVVRRWRSGDECFGPRSLLTNTMATYLGPQTNAPSDPFDYFCQHVTLQEREVNPVKVMPRPITVSTYLSAKHSSERRHRTARADTATKGAERPPGETGGIAQFDFLDCEPKGKIKK